MKNKTLLGATIALSTLTGANTFTQDKGTAQKDKISSLSCSIDSKVRKEIKKGIHNFGKDDTVVLEIPADCRRTNSKDGKTTSWEHKTLYIDMKTAKSIHRNPDANEIVSTKGSRYIADAGSYVMNNSTYQLKANFKGKQNEVEDNDDLYAHVKNNLKTEKKTTDKVTKKETKPKETTVASKPKAVVKPSSKPTTTVATNTSPKKENKIVRELKRIFTPKKKETENVSKPKCNCGTVAKGKDNLVSSVSNKKVDPKVTKTKVPTKKTPSDKEIEDIIKNAGKKYS